MFQEHVNEFSNVIFVDAKIHWMNNIRNRESEGFSGMASVRFCHCHRGPMLHPNDSAFDQAFANETQFDPIFGIGVRDDKRNRLSVVGMVLVIPQRQAQTIHKGSHSGSKDHGNSEEDSCDLIMRRLQFMALAIRTLVFESIFFVGPRVLVLGYGSSIHTSKKFRHTGAACERILTFMRTWSCQCL